MFENDISKRSNFLNKKLREEENYITLGDNEEHSISHSHAQNHEHKNDRGKKRLIVASILTTVFVIGEFVAGILAKSTAVQADAAHMLTDLLGFCISLLAISLSERQRSKLYKKRTVYINSNKYFENIDSILNNFIII